MRAEIDPVRGGVRLCAAGVLLVAASLVRGAWAAPPPPPPPLPPTAAAAGTAAGGTAAGVVVTDAWIRWLPAGLPSAGYMTLRNAGAMPRVLAAVAAEDFGEASIHRSSTVEGMERMEPVATLTLVPRAEIRFAAGGYHLMLLQPKRTLHEGERIPVTLRFAGGDSLTVSFAVRGAGGPSP